MSLACAAFFVRPTACSTRFLPQTARAAYGPWREQACTSSLVLMALSTPGTSTLGMLALWHPQAPFAFVAQMARAAERVAVLYRATPNAKTVFERYSWPGLRIVDGNSGLLGESG